VEGVEEWESIRGGLKGVVIGEVLTCVKHPGSDHLSLTTVNAGTGEPLRIVCGAPNVREGQKVPVAMVGTTLFFKDKELVIKEAKIRGELSQGMICAEDELGLGTSHDGIMVLDPSAKPGTQAAEFFQVEQDFIFEIGLTPNRTDATSHIGVARDLVAVLNNKPGTSGSRSFQVKVPDVSTFAPDNTTRVPSIIIEDPKACPRYTGITISNVTVKESPAWLKNKLTAIGLRPINNIVDITNFILHETGHPLHAFDADKIPGNKVIVKKLAKGTHFTTLDGIDRELSDKDLMICNTEGPMCIAGVFGGLESGVTENSKNLFIESAYFDPRSIRKSAKLHGLQTDASFRFERGADYNITVYALKRAAMLIKEVAGGEISSEIVDIYPEQLPNPGLHLRWNRVDRLAGLVIERETVKNILVSLGIRIISETGEGVELEIPSFKADVIREADVTEEILRIYGYNNIGFPASIKSAISYIEKPDKERVQNVISDHLSSNGFYEIINNSLTKSSYYDREDRLGKENTVRIYNPLSADLDVMRQTLLFGGLESIVYNQNRKFADARFYEFGNTYHYNKYGSGEGALGKYSEEKHLALFLTGNIQVESWNSKERMADFFDLKGFVNVILFKAGIELRDLKTVNVSDSIIEKGLAYLSGGRQLVSFGALSRELMKEFDCRQQVWYADFNWDLLVAILPVENIQYSEIPKFPEVRRDLALLLDKPVTFETLEKLAYQTENKLLKKANLFDVYEGDKIESGKKSYALSFILQDENKTLKDEEIDKVMNNLMRVYKEQLNAQIR
jgi:phenylalanyl-tRNA synthetase beta chain